MDDNKNTELLNISNTTNTLTLENQNILPDISKQDKTNLAISTPDNKIEIKNINHLVLSGGGFLGFGYIGTFRYLEDTGIIKNIKTITGCSAGAIFGSLCAVNYSSIEMEKIITEANFKKYINISADSILNFLMIKGLSNCNEFVEFIRYLMKNKTNNPDITFKEVYDIYGINLQIGVSNLTQYKFEIFNYKNKPNLPIVLGIKASIAIPFLYEPVVIDNDIYCDGGLLNNLPMDIISQDIISQDIISQDIISQDIISQDTTDNNFISTLGICLINKHTIVNASNYKLISITQYLSTIMTSLSMTAFKNKKKFENDKKYKIILMEIPTDVMTCLKFDAKPEDFTNIINIGYETMKKNTITLT